jgi:hypothetical protein
MSISRDVNCLDLIVVDRCIEGVFCEVFQASYPLDLEIWMPQSKTLLLADSPALFLFALYHCC